MEKTKKAKVVPYFGDWTDIGTWDALYKCIDKDENKNVSQGDVILEDVSNCLIHSENRLIAAVGVNNLAIIETSDAILVMNKDSSQDVRKIVTRIKTDNRQEYQHHTKVHRPWGTYQTVDFGKNHQVKRIIVNPGERLSMQMHHYRAEHWVVVSGRAKVQNGGTEICITKNESTYIPAGVIHSLENIGETPLELIEVQSGTYFGEDDIVRFNDRYGR